MSEAVSIDVREIMRYLPHRYPFLLVDRVTEFEANVRVKAIKNVTINEPFFMGHFDGYPVMPGVLIIEALAQAAGILSIKSVGERPENELYFFVGIDNARFKRQVVPGDQLTLEVEQLAVKRGIAKYSARALVDGQVACEAEIMCAKREV
ncbi:3-hydroxyacyl-[acyl-carrier-protein] dehydratase [Crenobacter luteus]|uniref:3-hydroxyacyl-[acyl-carrier-protein] dehydratase FabZ n=1 Tax=Crenobacter luteus TaxID=1452487 RepID=A0A165G264_9NEIS|nr:3-hydroxyacyl-ACP dehydratase FabZ [Crenobacter luteus]KZE34909.1 3-hydroxyacyl-[acyl-carrier-protein] dehydratase FabZ [Crenobacter luteus]TCP12150.1 3-hydroxyacyl-[acyl-carrier-protein] dehydratase [Crenobacter luteus]